MNDTIAAERIPLGKTGLEVSQIGLGCWQWGDKLFWDYGRGGFNDADLRAGFDASLQAGIDFFDTAESYGSGRSETLLGLAVQQTGQKVFIATKYMPYPWRISRRELLRAVRHSLKRLQVERIDLYQIHMPFFPMPTSHWVAALADVFEAGLVRAVGVSNYSREQTQQAVEILAKRGIPLASNQVDYSLWNRTPEKNGLLQTCRELGVTLIAYSPLSQGLLTGKYTPQKLPTGVRRVKYGADVAKIQPLIKLMRSIGANHSGKTPAQVAINWLICKGSLPIPGAKNLRQAEENIGAIGWRLTAEEVVQLEEIRQKIT